MAHLEVMLVWFTVWPLCADTSTCLPLPQCQHVPPLPMQAPGPFDVVILDLMHQSLLQALQLLAHPAEAQVGLRVAPQ